MTNKSLILTVSIIALLSTSGAEAFAATDLDAEIQKLESEVKALQKQVNDLKAAERKQAKNNPQAAISTPQPAIAAAPSNAGTPAPASPALAQTIVPIIPGGTAAGQPATEPLTGSKLDYNNRRGISFISPDGKNSVTVRGYGQVDGRFPIADRAGNDQSEFLIRAARPVFLATSGDASFRFMPEFAGSTPKVYDLYADYHFSDPLNIRVGKDKTPIGLERLVIDNEQEFVERGLPTNLVPNRDVGVNLFGSLIPELDYRVGVVDGAYDLQNNDADTDGGKDIVGRLFTHPFKRAGIDALKGLGFGIAGSTGQHDGTAKNPELPSYLTMSQVAFFNYGSTVIADGTNWRLSPQGYYYYGPFGLLAEYVESTTDVSKGSAHGNIANRAWQVETSYVLTGENVDYHSVVPDEPFDIHKGTWGAFELVGRYGELKIDGSAFPVFASAATSAREAREWVGGLNWYLNYNMKFNIDYANTNFSGGAVGGDRQTERTILSRVQYKF